MLSFVTGLSPLWLNPPRLPEQHEMSDTIQLTGLDEARDEAFRKIGRNVVNFQKMEAMLKYLIAHGSLKG